MKIIVFGCEMDEAAVFEKVASHMGVEVTLVKDNLSRSNAWMAKEYDCVSVSHKSQVSELMLLALKMAGIRYISTRSIGFDHIDKEAAKKMGIVTGNVSYSADSVADFTVMLLLMIVRNMKSIYKRTEQYDYRLESNRAKELRDMTVGVVGTGHIGSAVIERMKGFGCNILTYNQNSTLEELDMLTKESDIITLHLPLNASTHHFINKSRIEKMKDNAFLINTGRG